MEAETEKTKTRVFLAHPKDCDDEKLWWWVGAVKHWLEDGGYEAEVVLGRQDFDKHAASEGNFDAWARSVATRRDTFTGQKVYDSIFVPGVTIGKATFVIVQTAFHVKTPVFVLGDWNAEGQVEINLAADVIVTDPRDYRTGYRLILS